MIANPNGAPGLCTFQLACPGLLNQVVALLCDPRKRLPLGVPVSTTTVIPSPGAIENVALWLTKLVVQLWPAEIANPLPAVLPGHDVVSSTGTVVQLDPEPSHLQTETCVAVRPVVELAEIVARKEPRLAPDVVPITRNDTVELLSSALSGAADGAKIAVGLLPPPTIFDEPAPSVVICAWPIAGSSDSATMAGIRRMIS